MSPRTNANACLTTMSISFFAATSEGRPLIRCSCDLSGPEELLLTCPACKGELNLCSTRASELLTWIGLRAEQCGHHSARDLAARCRRRLWDEERNHDPALSGEAQREALGLPQGGARAIMFGRDAGYLRDRTAQLLSVAELAGDGWVAWS